MTLELKCKHAFHEECCRPWLKEYKTCRCVRRIACSLIKERKKKRS